MFSQIFERERETLLVANMDRSRQELILFFGVRVGIKISIGVIIQFYEGNNLPLSPLDLFYEVTLHIINTNNIFY